MLEKGMQKTWHMLQNGAQMGAKIKKKSIKKRRPKIDAKKGGRGHRRLEGQRVGRAAPILILYICIYQNIQHLCFVLRIFII